MLGPELEDAVVFGRVILADGQGLMGLITSLNCDSLSNCLKSLL